MHNETEGMAGLRESILPAPEGAPPDAAGLLDRARRRKRARHAVQGGVTTACLVFVACLAWSPADTRQSPAVDAELRSALARIEVLQEEMAALRASLNALETQIQKPVQAPAPARLTQRYWQPPGPAPSARPAADPAVTAAVLFEAARLRERRGLDVTGRYEEIITRFPGTPSAEQARKEAGT